MKNSFFDKNLLETKIAKHSNKCPQWLTSAVTLMNENTDAFVCKEDKNRYIVEFIYPH